MYLLTRTSTRTTHFPYTTLFRSVELLDPSRGRNSKSRSDRARAFAGGVVSSRTTSRAFSRRSKFQDRKSTRLNSSHTVISYAVFCLKKKMIIVKVACDLVIINII